MSESCQCFALTAPRKQLLSHLFRQGWQTWSTMLIINIFDSCHMFFFVHFSHRLTDSDAALCHQRARPLLWSTLNAEHCAREDRDLMHVSCLCDCCSNTRELQGAKRHVGSNPQPARPLWRKSWLPPHIPQVFHVVKLAKRTLWSKGIPKRTLTYTAHWWLLYKLVETHQEESEPTLGEQTIC